MTIWTENGEVKRLVLPCNDNPSDILVMEPIDLGHGRLMISINDGNDISGADDSSRSVHLNEDQARLLFNALGVWLHRRGPH